MKQDIIMDEMVKQLVEELTEKDLRLIAGNLLDKASEFEKLEFSKPEIAENLIITIRKFLMEKLTNGGDITIENNSNKEIHDIYEAVKGGVSPTIERIGRRDILPENIRELLSLCLDIENKPKDVPEELEEPESVPEGKRENTEYGPDQFRL